MEVALKIALVLARIHDQPSVEQTVKGKARNIDNATEILVQVGKTRISDKLPACPTQLLIVTFKLLCLGVTTCLMVSPYKSNNLITYCLVMVLLVLDVKKTICGAYMICQESHFVGLMEMVLRTFRF